uniref:LAGLIDADG_2 domain-containing protein n=1 Tax=Strongyloides venezuelensis TaxID=75913 RepID=A0A0K0FWA8_STRVS
MYYRFTLSEHESGSFNEKDEKKQIFSVTTSNKPPKELITARRFIPISTYSTGIIGGLTCRYHNKRNALVMISDNNRYKIDRKPLSKTIVYFGKQFSLVGSIRSLYKPFLYAKIVHTCTRMKNPFFVRIIVKRIQSKYINKYTQLRFYNLGKIELSRYPVKLMNLLRIHYV